LLYYKFRSFLIFGLFNAWQAFAANQQKLAGAQAAFLHELARVLGTEGIFDPFGPEFKQLPASLELLRLALFRLVREGHMTPFQASDVHRMMHLAGATFFDEYHRAVADLGMRNLVSSLTLGGPQARNTRSNICAALSHLPQDTWRSTLERTGPPAHAIDYVLAHMREATRTIKQASRAREKGLKLLRLQREDCKGVHGSELWARIVILRGQMDSIPVTWTTVPWKLD
jgi:hypothetical protein